MHRRIMSQAVAPFVFGAMPLSTDGRPHWDQAVATLLSALDADVRLVDTADAYCLSAEDVGHNERLVADVLALRPAYASDVIVATKGGHVRGRDGSWSTDGRPEYLRFACERSLRALRREVIDLYQLHRPDPAVPFLDSVGALAALRADGLIRYVGLSNVTVQQLDDALTIVPVASVQNEFSPDFRTSRAEIEACEARGIAFLAYAPLGGAGRAPSLAERHPAFATIASKYRVTPQRVAVAWALAQSDAVFPIVGARRAATFADSFAALSMRLTQEDLAILDEV